MINQCPKMDRVSKKQKRVRAKSGRGSKSKRTTSAAKRKLKAKALHLLLGPEHFDDRAAAARLRLFPNVPRKLQSPFPRDVEVGFAGHYKSGIFKIQGREEFVADFESNVENAYYWRIDKRSNRKPQREDSGLIETNAALSSGLSRVFADLVRDGRLDFVRNTARLASEAGMALLCVRTGYLPCYLALHPDAEGTLSTHYGAWTTDPVKHELLGISATGKRGKKGPKNLGDCYISILRHNRMIELPKWVKYRPLKNLKERDPTDWAIAEEMDRVVKEELTKLPNGPDLLKRADKYQKEDAEDWLRRYQSSKAGVDKQYAEHAKTKTSLEEQRAELEKARARIAELESSQAALIETGSRKMSVLKSARRAGVFTKLSRFLTVLWKRAAAFAALLLKLSPAAKSRFTRKTDAGHRAHGMTMPSLRVAGGAAFLDQREAEIAAMGVVSFEDAIAEAAGPFSSAVIGGSGSSIGNPAGAPSEIADHSEVREMPIGETRKAAAERGAESKMRPDGTAGVEESKARSERKGSNSQSAPSDHPTLE